MFVNARLSSGPPRSEGQALRSSVKLSGLPGQLPPQPRGVQSLTQRIGSWLLLFFDDDIAPGQSDEAPLLKTDFVPVLWLV